MAGRQAGFFDVDERLQRLSILGDQLEAYAKAIDFELFPPELETALAYAKKSAVRARVEHVLADQKDRMGVFVRTIDLARTALEIGMANLVYKIRRTLWLDRRAAPA